MSTCMRIRVCVCVCMYVCAETTHMVSNRASIIATTIGAGSFIDTPTSLYKKGVLNIQNPKDDFCFLWRFLAHIHRVGDNAVRTAKYEHFMRELNTKGLNFPLKFTDISKFENLNPPISVNDLVFENNEVFPLYASKHRDRIHHVNLLMISNIEGKFHYLLIRNLSTLVAGHRKVTCEG